MIEKGLGLNRTSKGAREECGKSCLIPLWLENCIAHHNNWAMQINPYLSGLLHSQHNNWSQHLDKVTVGVRVTATNNRRDIGQKLTTSCFTLETALMVLSRAGIMTFTGRIKAHLCPKHRPTLTPPHLPLAYCKN